MVRIAAQEKLLFYPTQSEIPPLIALHFRTWAGPSNCLDPCAGTAVPFVELLMELQTTGITNGIELDLERAALAKPRLDQLIQGDALNQLTEDKFDILFVNPPYDYSTDGERLEAKFIKHWAPALDHDGTMIAIVPELMVRDKELRRVMNIHFRRWEILKYPEHLYSQWKQVVILATKRNQHDPGNNSNDPLIISGELGKDISDLFYLTRSYQGKEAKFYEKTILDVSEITPFIANPCNNFLSFLGEPNKNSVIKPIQPLKDTNAALLACAGMFNDISVLDKNSVELVVCGTAFKGETTVVTEDEATGKRSHVKEEKWLTQFVVLNTGSNTLESFDEQTNPDEFAEFMNENATTFVETARGQYGSLYDPLINYEDFSHINPPKVIKNGYTHGMLSLQEESAAAIINGWLSGMKTINLIASMGSGKTLMSVAAMYTYWVIKKNKPNHKCIVLCPQSPTDLATKWADEVNVIMENVNAWAISISSITEVDEAMKKEGFGILILRENKAKENSTWFTTPPPGKWQKKEILVEDKETLELHSIIKTVKVPFCPGCGKTIPNSVNEQIDKNLEQEQEGKYAGNRLQVKCSDLYSEKKPKPDAIPHFIGCGHQYYQYFVKHGAASKPGRAMYSIARYMRQHYKNRYSLIVDELHEYKSGTTAQRAIAAFDLIEGAKKTLHMTGTFFNGKYSAAFYMLYWASHKFRDQYGYDEMKMFGDRYGTKETTITETPSKTSRTGTNVSEPKVKPGIGLHPSLVTLTIENTIFLNKWDFSMNLPPYDEYKLFVEPNKAHKEAVLEYSSDLFDIGTDWWGSEDPQIRRDAMSIFSWNRYAEVGLLDNPFQEDWHHLLKANENSVHHHKKWEIPEELDEDELLPKEEALIRLVLKEKGEDRKCLLYVHQMNKRPAQGRLTKLLARYGIKAATMLPSVKKRRVWVQQQITNGIDIIITNHKLVKVGIDLIETPTVIWWSIDKNMDTMEIPQANERPHRIIQTLPVRVFYLGYLDTAQAKAAHYVAKKNKMMLRFGGEQTGGLAAIELDDDVVDAVQSHVVESTTGHGFVQLEELPELPAIVTMPYKNGNGKTEPEPELKPESESSSITVNLQEEMGKIEEYMQKVREEVAQEKEEERAEGLQQLSLF